jgi:hypothetical protein
MHLEFHVTYGEPDIPASFFAAEDGDAQNPFELSQRYVGYSRVSAVVFVSSAKPYTTSLPRSI